MFEYTLENGKERFTAGLVCLAAAIISGTVLGIIAAFVTYPPALIATTVVLGLISAILAVFASIQIIFGAVVYHAERTSARATKDIVKDNVEWSRLDEKNKSLSTETIKKAKQTKSPVIKVIHYKNADAVEFKTEDGNAYFVYDVNDKVFEWQKLSRTELTKLFYEKLINDAQLQQKTK